MAGIEGDKRPGRHEAAFTAGISGRAGQQPGSGEWDSLRTRQSAENRILGVVSAVQRQESEPVDPYRISYALMDYQYQVNERIGEAKGIKSLVKSIPHQTEDERAFIDTIRRVRDAFDIIAFPHFPPNYQQALSYEVYQEIEDVADEDKADYPRTPDKRITLTDTEKSIVGRLSALAGIPDDPQQRTYSYGSLPHIVNAKYQS